MFTEKANSRVMLSLRVQTPQLQNYTFTVN